MCSSCVRLASTSLLLNQGTSGPIATQQVCRGVCFSKSLDRTLCSSTSSPTLVGQCRQCNVLAKCNLVDARVFLVRDKFPWNARFNHVGNALDPEVIGEKQ